MKKNYFHLLIIIFLYTCVQIFDQNFIFTDEFIYVSLREEFSESAIRALISSENRFGWIAHVVLPVIILIKILFTSFCIIIGVILLDIEFEFKDIFKSATLSENIFLISQAIFSLLLFLNWESLDIENAVNFFPLSMLSFYGVENVVPWLHYPLQTLNIFEVFYILFISWLLSKQWKPNFIESINIVLPSYGIGLLLWMVLVVFLTLQIS